MAGESPPLLMPEGGREKGLFTEAVRAAVGDFAALSRDPPIRLGLSLASAPFMRSGTALMVPAPYRARFTCLHNMIRR